MIILSFRLIFIILDLFIGILFKWWNWADIKAYMLSQIRLWRSFFLVAVYSDVVILAFLYFKHPEVLVWFGNLLNLYPSIQELNGWLLDFEIFGWGVLPFRKPRFVPRASDVLKNFSIGGKLFRNKGRSLLWLLNLATIPVTYRWNRSYARKSFAFIQSCHRIWSRSGTKFLVLYLKAAQILLQQSIGGYKVSDTRSFKVAVSRTSSGIPRIIPKSSRVLIRSRSRGEIRFWMTLLGLYRILEFPGKVKLDSITDPRILPVGKEVSYDLTSPSAPFSSFIPTFYLELRKLLGLTSKLTNKFLLAALANLPPSFSLATDYWKSQMHANYFPIMKSSATTDADDLEIATSIPALRKAAWLWLSKGKNGGVGASASPSIKGGTSLAGTLYNWCIETGNDKLWEFLLRLAKSPNLHDPITCEPLVPPGQDIMRDPFILKCLEKSSIDSWVNPLDDLPKGLGKLSLKEEAAGKVRVFAMVDAFTQWLLAPLHSAILSLLSLIPQDGTFDQHKPVKLLLRQRPKGLWSYDLTAATDRVPVWYQVQLLTPPLGFIGAALWRNLLVGRTYYLKDRPVRYTVGQPMGALSSWAMLALIHHALLQYASYRVCIRKGTSYSWFVLYAILGDDIIIGDAEVAAEYLKVMEEIGAGINLTKSLVSEKLLVGEFAKRFYTPQDCSMVPLKEVLAARFDFSELLNFVRKYKLSLAQTLQFAGFGYKVRGATNRLFSKSGSRVRNLLLVLSYPGNPMGLKSSIDWLRQIGLNRLSTISIPSTLQSIRDSELLVLSAKYDKDTKIGWKVYRSILMEKTKFAAHPWGSPHTDLGGIDPRSASLMKRWEDLELLNREIWKIPKWHLDKSLLHKLVEIKSKLDAIKVTDKLEQRTPEKPASRFVRPSKLLRFRRHIKR